MFMFFSLLNHHGVGVALLVVLCAVLSAGGQAAFSAALLGVVSSSSGSLGTSTLLGLAPWCGVHPCKGEMGSDVWGSRLEPDEPGLVPLSGVTPLCEGLVSGSLSSWRPCLARS